MIGTENATLCACPYPRCVHLLGFKNMNENISGNEVVKHRGGAQFDLVPILYEEGFQYLQKLSRENSVLTIDGLTEKENGFDLEIYEHGQANSVTGALDAQVDIHFRHAVNSQHIVFHYRRISDNELEWIGGEEIAGGAEVIAECGIVRVSGGARATVQGFEVRVSVGTVRAGARPRL